LALFRRKKNESELSDLSTTGEAKTGRIKKMGCLNVSVISLAMVGIFIYAAITLFSTAINPFAIFGLNSEDVKRAFFDLNQPVNTATLLADANTPTVADHNTVRDKINASFTPFESMADFGFYTIDGHLIPDNLFPEMGTKNASPLTITQQDMAAFLDQVLNSGEFTADGYVSLLGMLSIKGDVLKSRFQEADGNLSLDLIVKLDLTEFKAAIEALAGVLDFLGIRLPDTVYLSTNVVLEIAATNTYSTKTASMTINQLSASANDNVLKVLSKLLFASTESTSSEIAASFGDFVAETFSSLAKGWGADFAFSGNSLLITKST